MFDDWTNLIVINQTLHHQEENSKRIDSGRIEGGIVIKQRYNQKLINCCSSYNTTTSL